MLITRPLPGASETAATLRARGVVPVIAPCLEIRRLPASLPDPVRLQAVLAASGNAVLLPPTYHHLPLLAVGDATARLARDAGFGQVYSAAGDAAALAALATDLLHPQAGAILLPTARGQGGPLTQALRTAGFRVLRRAIYAAVPPRLLPGAAIAAIAADDLDTALFFSAETARHFVRLLPAALHARLRGIEALAIAAPTAAALAPLPWRRIRVALHPSQSGLLALL